MMAKNEIEHNGFLIKLAPTGDHYQVFFCGKLVLQDKRFQKIIDAQTYIDTAIEAIEALNL